MVEFHTDGSNVHYQHNSCIQPSRRLADGDYPRYLRCFCSSLPEFTPRNFYRQTNSAEFEWNRRESSSRPVARIDPKPPIDSGLIGLADVGARTCCRQSQNYSVSHRNMPIHKLHINPSQTLKFHTLVLGSQPFLVPFSLWRSRRQPIRCTPIGRHEALDYKNLLKIFLMLSPPTIPPKQRHISRNSVPVPLGEFLLGEPGTVGNFRNRGFSKISNRHVLTNGLKCQIQCHS